MAKATLEKYQVFIYLSFIACGLLLGSLLPSHVGFLELMLWPLLGLLMYTTFTQVPLTHLRTAFTDTRFITAAVVGNFIVLPLVVWGLMHLGPSHPAAQLGILLVLLLPCTDWFITFTHLGGGDTRHAIAFTPISLLLQLLLLPVYLWLFMGAEVTIGLLQKELIAAFLGLIVLPLLAAFITEK
ncbi:MAG: bile acid:sodium symporter, partial [Acinetobacter sp.]|nr:bile acid:sodium symporter [Acinetobacter sp.]